MNETMVNATAPYLQGALHTLWKGNVMDECD